MNVRVMRRSFRHYANTANFLATPPVVLSVCNPNCEDGVLQHPMYNPIRNTRIYYARVWLGREGVGGSGGTIVPRVQNLHRI